MADKQINIEVLPTKKHKRYGEIIDWKKSVGLTLDFQYDEIHGIVKILDYIDGNHIKISVNDGEYIVSPERIRKCEFGNILQRYNNDFVFGINDIVTTNIGKIIIKKQIHKIINNKGWKRRAYQYECLICGNMDEIFEQDLSRGKGCNCCANQKLVVGINDMWTTAPEIASLLYNPNDGYTHMKSCSARLDWKCPICGMKISNKICNQIYRQGRVSCPRCSDGISYPNKFIYFLLKDIGINIKREQRYDWNSDYIFDIVIENEKLIIEMDGGLGHGNRKFGGGKDSTGKFRDDIKDNNAKINGYKTIRIDCSYYGIENRFDFIKSSVLKSDLAKLYDLSNIDWEYISERSENSYVKQACDLYNNGIISTRRIAENLDLHYATIIQYLKRGTKYGWCNYDPTLQHKLSISHKCYCNETKEYFDSYKDAAEKYKLPKHHIVSVINKISQNCRGIISDIGKNNILGMSLSFKLVDE